MSQRHDPEVQRNGFEAILEGANVDPVAMKDWFEGDGPESFDPTVTWEENLRRFREHLRGAQGVVSGASPEQIDDLLDETG